MRSTTFTTELSYISIALSDNCFPAARYWMEELRVRLDSTTVVTEARFKASAREALERFGSKLPELEAKREEIKRQQRL